MKRGMSVFQTKQVQMLYEAIRNNHAAMLRLIFWSYPESPDFAETGLGEAYNQ